MSTGLMKNGEKRTGTALANHSHFLGHFRNEMNRLLDDFRMGFDFSIPGFADKSGEHPIKIDLKDNGNELVLVAEVPGVDLGDLTIAATPHYVSLSAEKKQEKDEHQKEYYRVERSYGYFRRVIQLPCEIDKDNVDAVYKDGVLRVSMPKSQTALSQEKKVTVKAG
jgi:HSP20 family protein